MLCSASAPPPTTSCARKSTPTCVRRAPMARRPAPDLVAAFLLVLALRAIDAARGQQPTNSSDAAALHDVFQRWRLEAAENPCGKRVWSESFAVNASVGCDCSRGLECRITHLNVTGFWNITEIPPALFNLTELVSLDLSNNKLSGSVPPEVGNLSKLETWHFNNNNLSGSFPLESSLLRNLKSLWMFDNHIEGPIPEFIQNFTNLTDLRLYGMKLQGPIPQNFSKLINLEHLMLGDLEGNPSTNFIENWANLSTLSLRKCGLTGQILNPPRNLPKLKYLDLTSNNLSGPISLLLSYKNSLNFIYVGNNSFSERLPTEIVQPFVPLDVSYNPSVNGSLPNNPVGQKWPINYIGTSVDASGTMNSESLTVLNCLRTKECNRNNLTRHKLYLYLVNYLQDQNIRKDFDIAKEAGGFRKPTNITQVVTVNKSILVIHLYWSGRGTCCIPYEGAYGPLVSAIKVTRYQKPEISPPPAPHSSSSRQDEKRRGIIAGIAALGIAAAVISSSVVYLWWKWVSLVKRSMA
nr:unnamed protein product [Digitaria exilis]